jgi:hypothetical protein
MLNTKSIKKPNLELSSEANSEYKINNGINKVVTLESSKQKELENIVKSANSEIESKGEQVQEYGQKNPNEQIGINGNNNIDKKVLREFTNDSYKDANLNVTNLIGGNRLLLASQLGNPDDAMNIFRPIQQIQLDNGIKTNCSIQWSVEQNCFVIIDGDSNHTISNDNILKSILSQEHNDFGIKKYIFITTWNSIAENFEFNFVESVLTNDFDMMIKIQNFIYDILNSFDNLDVTDTYNYQETILMFYYQLIIYLFNKQNTYIKLNEPNKIARVYSSLVYRFSSLVLKNIFTIKNDLYENNEILNKLLSIRIDILSQINFINEKIDFNFEQPQIKFNNFDESNTDTYTNTYTNTNSDKNSSLVSSLNTSNVINQSYESDSSYESESSNKSNKSNKSNSSKTYQIVNSRKLKKLSDDENYTRSKTENPIEGLKIINKNGSLVKKLKDVFSEDIQINTDNTDNTDSRTDGSDSDKNGYFEIDDNVSDYFRFKNQINLNKKNVQKLNPIENSFQSNIKSASVGSRETTNTKTQTQSQSYDPNSAIRNSKIFKVNL